MIDLGAEKRQWIHLVGAGEVLHHPDMSWYRIDETGAAKPCGGREAVALSALLGEHYVVLVPKDGTDRLQAGGWLRAVLTSRGQLARARIALDGTAVADLPMGTPAELRTSVLALAGWLARAARRSSDFVITGSGVPESAMRPLLVLDEVFRALSCDAEVAAYAIPEADWSQCVRRDSNGAQ
jgi:hypothetical protein